MPLRELSAPQRRCGRPFATFRKGAVRWSGAEPVRYRSSPPVTRSFCSRCGSPLAYEHDGSADEIDLYLGVFDDPARFPVRMHVHCGERVAWFDTTDRTPRYHAELGLGRAARSPAGLPPRIEALIAGARGPPSWWDQRRGDVARAGQALRALEPHHRRAGAAAIDAIDRAAIVAERRQQALSGRDIGLGIDGRRGGATTLASTARRDFLLDFPLDLGLLQLALPLIVELALLLRGGGGRCSC